MRVTAKVKPRRSNFGPKLLMTMLALLAVVLLFIVSHVYSHGHALALDQVSSTATRLHLVKETHKEATIGLVKKDDLSSLSGSEKTISKILKTASPPPPPVCNGVANLELWGDVVKPGMGPGSIQTDTAEQCCAECHSSRGCNVWVWCMDKQTCGRQCWLKRTGSQEAFKGMKLKPGPPNVHWTSGTIFKDFDQDASSMPPLEKDVEVFALKTAYGDIRIRLKPDWSRSSVDFVQTCQFYRAEPRFLLQGSMQAFIPANNQTTPGPKFMERGDIGWAGGFSGPDFFIYLGDQPATHWNHDHTVWGLVADEESLKVAETIVNLAASAPKPGDMHMLTNRIQVCPEDVLAAGVQMWVQVEQPKGLGLRKPGAMPP
eukprot:gene4629-14821_t